jgi:hypothetical protein
MTPRNTSNDTAFIRIDVIENPIEAQVVADALRQERIPHEVRSFHDTAYDGLFQTQMGWGELRAPAAFREKILEILEDIRREDQSGLETPGR